MSVMTRHHIAMKFFFYSIRRESISGEDLDAALSLLTDFVNGMEAHYGKSVTSGHCVAQTLFLHKM